MPGIFSFVVFISFNFMFACLVAETYITFIKMKDQGAVPATVQIEH